MTEKRVNGYPVSSTGFGPKSNSDNTSRSRSRSRLYGLSSSSRSQSVNHLDSVSKTVTVPEPRVTSNLKLEKEQEQLSRRRIGFFSEMAQREREQHQRRNTSVDDSSSVKPQRFRRATEKYVKPKSTFYIANPVKKDITKPSSDSTSSAGSSSAASSRRPPQRVRSIQRRSASVDDMLNNSNGGNGNRNLMSFSSDEDEGHPVPQFQRSSRNPARTVSEIAEISIVDAAVLRAAHEAMARAHSEPLPASAAQSTVMTSSNAASAPRDLQLNAELAPAGVPEVSSVVASSPMTRLPVTSSNSVRLSAPEVLPKPLVDSSLNSAAASALTTSQLNSAAALTLAASHLNSAATSLNTAASPPISSPSSAAASQITSAISSVYSAASLNSVASSASPVNSAASPTILAAASPSISPASQAVSNQNQSATVRATRPIPPPRPRELQTTNMDLFLDFGGSSSSMTTDELPFSPRQRRSPTINVNRNPEPATDVLIDLNPVASSSSSSSDEADSGIPGSSASTSSFGAARPSSTSSGSSIMAASSLSLSNISSSVLEHEVMPRRRSDASPPLSALGSGPTWRSTSSNLGIETCETPGNLKMYDQIVWFTENGVPETGTVKWLGKIKDTFYAGIEFANHVGNSSGKIKGKRLFTASLTKGRFVPLTELILHSDFYEGFPYPTNAPAHPRLIPKPSTKKYVPSAIMCVICQDPLLNPEEEVPEATEPPRTPTTPAPAEEQKEMVTTHCGHLFHATCLKQWFDVKSRVARQPCPYCQGLMDVDHVIRIYPVQGKL